MAALTRLPFPRRPLTIKVLAVPVAPAPVRAQAVLAEPVEREVPAERPGLSPSLQQLLPMVLV